MCNALTVVIFITGEDICSNSAKCVHVHISVSVTHQ